MQNHYIGLQRYGINKIRTYSVNSDEISWANITIYWVCTFDPLYFQIKRGNSHTEIRFGRFVPPEVMEYEIQITGLQFISIQET